jgi:YHS domain-containing protein
MLRKLTVLTLGFTALALFAVAGCDNTEAPKTDPPAPQKGPEAQAPEKKEGAGEHAHKPGGHGGSIVEIGRDNYHAEAVFGKDGVVRVYTLGKDEAVVLEVEAQELIAYARADGDAEAQEFPLKPVRRSGDAEGKVSQFVGSLPVALRGKRVEVTVPSIRIEGVRYRFGFASAPAGGHDDMPAKVADEAERKLYLTPGGLYTEADIKANGSITASEKFKGVMASHDLQPKPGDPICPITLTLANPRFTWIVGGKAYTFCCPPCVDEFVQRAKEHPEQIKEPEEYVKH